MRRLMTVTLSLAVSAALTLGPGPLSQSATRADTTSEPVVGMIAYAGRGPDRARTEIYSIRTDGSHRRQLTTTGGFDPEWSPDGTQIAFARRGGIWLMDATGGSQRRVAEGFDPAWSPDSRRLSYACQEGADLCHLDLQTSIESVVVPSTKDWRGARGSTWSPDGAWIAFTRLSSSGDDYASHRQIFRVRPNGTDLTAIPNTYPEGDMPAWSPDGGSVLYTESYGGRGGEGSGDLWSIRPDGTAKTRVTRVFGTEQAGAWSPDGQRIAMESEAAGYPFQAGIWTMGLDGTSRYLVVRDGWRPSWRPNFMAAPTSLPPPASGSGPRIAFVAATETGHDLFTVRPDGTRVRRLTSTGGVQEPVWSPGHSRIAYIATTATGRSRMSVLDVRSGDTRRVGRADPDAGGPAWSPNGSRMAWGTFRSVVVKHLGTGERYRIPLPDDEGCCARDVTWSPDGRWIAVSMELGRASSDIMIVPAKGGRFRHVTRLRGEERHLDWSPNGRRIVFAHMSGPRWRRGARVLRIKPDGTGLRRVIKTRALDLTPAWSPNGRRVALYSDGPRSFGASPRPGLWTVGPKGWSPRLVVRDRTIAYVDW